jgi:hypothetical protein
MTTTLCGVVSQYFCPFLQRPDAWEAPDVIQSPASVTVTSSVVLRGKTKTSLATERAKGNPIHDRNNYSAR